MVIILVIGKEPNMREIFYANIAENISKSNTNYIGLMFFDRLVILN